MLFSLKVVSPADYDAWLTQTKAIADSGTDPMFTTYTGANASTFANAHNAQGSHT
jgi:heme/copper-type cytochrome/quinol oxidase subunit 2